VLNDQEQTTDAPDHQMATFEFEQFTAVWEHRKFGDNNSEKHKIGCLLLRRERCAAHRLA
jgi:hypothetical protein